MVKKVDNLKPARGSDYQDGAIERYERGNQSRSARWFEIRPESEDLVRWRNTPGDAITHNAGQVLTNAETQEPIFGELLAGEAVEGFLIHAL